MEKCLGLAQKQRRFPLLIVQLIEHMDLAGYEMAFAEAYRTPTQAAINEQEGTGIANSLHTLRLALDLLLFKDGLYLTNSDDYKIAGDFWKSLSVEAIQCVWGGDFKKPDGNHFSIEHNNVR